MLLLATVGYLEDAEFRSLDEQIYLQNAEIRRQIYTYETLSSTLMTNAQPEGITCGSTRRSHNYKIVIATNKPTTGINFLRGKMSSLYNPNKLFSNKLLNKLFLWVVLLYDIPRQHLCFVKYAVSGQRKDSAIFCYIKYICPCQAITHVLAFKTTMPS